MDVIIISTNNVAQENFWQEQLALSLPSLLDSNPIILAVHEDWHAGSGLGTFYALMRAREKGVILYGFDILDKLSSGASISIYHTVGTGKGLAPLTCSELSNKCAIQLPSNPSLRVLEAVIKQSQQFCYPNRLSVFRGDQLFFPETALSTPSHHIEIYSRKDKYLGAFTLSKEIFLAFLDEYQLELGFQQSPLDAEEHFWNPLISNSESRIRTFARAFTPFFPHLKLFGFVDLGDKSYLWDYSSVQSFHNTIRKALTNTAEGKAMRTFYNLPEVDANHNIILDCNIWESSIQNSLLYHVTAKNLKLKNGLIGHSHLNKLEGEECLLYHAHESSVLYMPSGTIRSDSEMVPLYSSLARDSRIDWIHKLPQNSKSFEEIYWKHTNQTPTFYTMY